MRKIKGLKKKGAPVGVQTPTGEEWRAIEEKINKKNFPDEDDLRFARFVIRALSRYASSDAQLKLRRITPEGRAALERILAEVGFEFDFPKEQS